MAMPVSLALPVSLSAPLALLALPSAAVAQGIAPPLADLPSGVLSLDASASTDVPADIVRIDLFYEQQGNDPAALAQALNQHTDAALKLTRQQDVVKVKTGAFSISPATDRDGRITAWRGRSELVLESRDFAAASRLAGQLGTTLQVGDVSFSLSPETQRQAENDLTKQAISAFRQQALAATQAFGYNGFTVREVNVGRNGGYRQPRGAPRMLYAASAAKSQDVPIEGGTSTVTVTVNGAVQMTR
ncbi:MAG: SIMPL domain-containing protein [Janthinobacterium lividum]